jgi:hypothetical protein
VRGGIVETSRREAEQQRTLCVPPHRCATFQDCVWGPRTPRGAGGRSPRATARHQRLGARGGGGGEQEATRGWGAAALRTDTYVGNLREGNRARHLLADLCSRVWCFFFLLLVKFKLEKKKIGSKCGENSVL